MWLFAHPQRFTSSTSLIFGNICWFWIWCQQQKTGKVMECYKPPVRNISQVRSWLVTGDCWKVYLRRWQGSWDTWLCKGYYYMGSRTLNEVGKQIIAFWFYIHFTQRHNSHLGWSIILDLANIVGQKCLKQYNADVFRNIFTVKNFSKL